MDYLPWKRFILTLCIDGKRTVRLGRFMMRKSAARECERLRAYKGYEPRVVDTKPTLIRRNNHV